MEPNNFGQIMFLPDTMDLILMNSSGKTVQKLMNTMDELNNSLTQLDISGFILKSMAILHQDSRYYNFSYVCCFFSYKK